MSASLCDKTYSKTLFNPPEISRGGRIFEELPLLYSTVPGSFQRVRISTIVFRSAHERGSQSVSSQSLNNDFLFVEEPQNTRVSGYHVTVPALQGMELGDSKLESKFWHSNGPTRNGRPKAQGTVVLQ